MKIVVTINGPGEAAGWLRPIADVAASRTDRDLSIKAVITPCQMSSGHETAVVARFAGVGDVERLVPYLRRLTIGRERDDADLVLHLGGDPAYALLLARILGVPAWTYGTSARYRRAFRRFLVPDERTARKLRARSVDHGRIEVIGQLVTDSVQHTRETPRTIDPARRTVLLLPGSREAQVRVLVPYYGEMIDLAAPKAPDVRWLMLASPFVSAEIFADAFASAGWAIASRPGEPFRATSPGGRTIELLSAGLGAFADVDLAVTIPGTNTLQLAAVGVPHIVITPGAHAEVAAFTGPLGLLNPSWWGAARIRRAALEHISRRTDYLAIPNIIASAPIVPELRGPDRLGDVEPPEVATAVVALLDAPHARQTMSARLKDVAGPPGAASRLVDLLMDWRPPTCASAS